MYLFGNEDELYKKYSQKHGKLVAEEFRSELMKEVCYNPKCAQLLKYTEMIVKVMQEELTTEHYTLFNDFVANTQMTVYSSSDVNIVAYSYDILSRFLDTGHTYIEYVGLPKKFQSIDAMNYVIQYLKKGYPYKELYKHTYNSLRKLLNVCDLSDHNYMAELYPGKEYFIDSSDIVREHRIILDDRLLEELLKISDTQEELDLLVLVYCALNRMNCLQLMQAYKDSIHNVNVTRNLVEWFDSGLRSDTSLRLRALFLFLSGKLSESAVLDIDFRKISISDNRNYVVVFDGITMFGFIGIDYAYFAERLKSYTNRSLFSSVHNVGACSVILLSTSTNPWCNLEKCIPLALEQFQHTESYLVEELAFEHGSIEEQMLTLIERENPIIRSILKERGYDTDFIQCFYRYFPLKGNFMDVILQKLRKETYKTLCSYSYRDCNNPPRLLLDNKKDKKGFNVDSISLKPIDFIMSFLKYVVKFIDTNYVSISYKSENGGYVEIRAY